MPGWAILAVVGLSIVGVIAAVLKARLPAMFVLLAAALLSGLALGADPAAVVAAVRKGTGEALGFVAVVIALGAMLGAMLEASGGIGTIARTLLEAFGERRAIWALVVIGIIVGIPLFFDVGFIILVPLITVLAKRAGRSVVLYALPVLGGLMTMHALLPPHPGPVAVAELIGTDYGLLALFGLACGIPAAIVAGPVYALWMERRGWLPDATPPLLAEPEPTVSPMGFWTALSAMFVPLVLIIAATVASVVLAEGPMRSAVAFVGHPFVALTIACALVWLLLARAGTSRDAIGRVMGKALEPAGVLVLVVGAGAAYKEVLIQSGAGEQVTALVTAAQLSPILFAFLLAGFVRVAQGSATVAMVTAAGLSAPLIAAAGLNPAQIALVTVAIGAGASIASHVNDTGFWLVKQYLGLSERQSFASWTISSSLAGLVMLLVALMIWPLV